MESIALMVVAFVGYLVAYLTYGRYLARRIFGVATVYLGKKGKPTVFTLVPMLVMIVITGAAMAYKIRDFVMGGSATLHLLVIGGAIVVLQVWMIVEIIVNYRGRPDASAQG